MKIYKLSKNERKFFADIIPDDINYQVGTEGYHSLGLFDEEAGNEPAGFAQFYSGYEDSAEELPYFRLTWLYVKEGYRYNGGGKMLVDTIINAAKVTKADHIIVSFPKEETGTSKEADSTGSDDKEDRAVLSDKKELKRCLKKARFQFDESEQYDMYKTLADCLSISILNGDIPKEVKVLSELGKKEWNMVFSAVPAEIAMALRAAMSGKDDAMYDLDLSCVYIKDAKIHGVLIVKGQTPECIMIDHIRQIHDSDPKIVLYMLKCAAAKSRNKYKGDHKVRIKSMSEPGVRLIQKVFADDKPIGMTVGKLKIK